MLLLAASLFITTPAPLELPRASAYLVTDRGGTRLEDRFDTADLWTSRTVEGRWIDDDGRVFMLATLSAKLPERFDTLSRAAYEKTRETIKKRDLKNIRAALAPLLPIETPELPKAPRQLPRGYADVDYWQGTNTSVIVCAFLSEKSDVWRLAVWELVEGDDFSERLKTFEDDFLGLEAKTFRYPDTPAKSTAERDLLRRDARHSVEAYDEWHVTDAETFVVLDDLPTRELTVAFTNDLAAARKRFAEVMPSPLALTNSLSVARIYKTRDEYLAALETSGNTDMAWSAAYWSPLRRELVAHGESTAMELLKTLRHEAFHQYFSYATAMMETSPWINEGYAQYFEDEDARDWKLDTFRPSPEELEAYSLVLPSIFSMDYEQFYAGTDEERRFKYRLAWSVAVFLEDGAPNVRFRPFESVKDDYLRELVKSQDPRFATAAAFKSREHLDRFVGSWLAYWKSLP